MRRIAVFVVPLLLVAIMMSPALADRRIALVIGNGAYRNAPQLPNPKNDAADVAAALKRTGFETILGLDLDKAGMDDAAIRFARAARAADIAIFYYSGHAMQFAGVNYLMPVDAKLADEADLRRMARVDDIVADIQQARNLRILVLDSCRDNPLAEDLKRSIGTRGVSVQRGLAKIDSPQGMIVAYSTQAGRTAEDGSGRNSPYTAAFLKHIEAADEIGTVFRRISADVYDATQRTQLPELSLSLIGEFYLAGQPAAAAGPAADEIAWSFLNKADVAALHRFSDAFPASRHKGEADDLVATLERSQRDARTQAADEQRKREEADALRAQDERERAAAEAQRSAEAERNRLAVVAPPVRPATPPAAVRPAVGVFPDGLSQNPKEWVMQTGNYANHRYSPLRQITADNVGKLQVAWMYSTGTLRGHEGGPLVVGDVMYVHTPFPNIVHALDLNNDGKLLWKYEPKQDWHVIPVMCCDTVNRGLAYGDGKIFLHQADTTVVALDARTGRVVWSVKNGDPGKAETGTSAPMVYKDKVYVGISGGEFGVRGHLTAYAVKTGRRLWRGYSTGPDSDTLLDPQRTTHLGKPVGVNSGTATWQGDQWKTGGGTTWGWYAVDPELNLIYYGTGNPSTWNPKQRPGDNRWSNTVFARDADTGAARWVYQFTPHDEWEYEGVNEMILADLNIGGVTRKALAHFDRNGFAYTLDRATGELLVAEKFDQKVNWASKVDMNRSSATYGRPQVVARYSTDQGGEDTNTRGICPTSLGAKNQQPAAFSPDTGLFYVPTNHLCMDYEPFRVSYTAGQPYVGATIAMYPPPGESNLGNFIAFDARAGKIVWSDPERFSVWSGALATAGGVVLYGTLEGYLKAVDATTGKELYKFKTPSGIVGNVMTYEHDNKQYIAVLSGVGGWAGIGLAAGLTDPRAGLGAVGAYAGLRNYTALGGQVVVFALP